MKKYSLLLLVMFSITLLLDSCSVQKRYHRKGFTVNWNSTSVGMKKNRKVIHTEMVQQELDVTKSKKKPSLIKNYKSIIHNDVAMVENTIPAPSFKSIPELNTETAIRNANVSNSILTAKDRSNHNLKANRKSVKKVLTDIKKNQKNKSSRTETVLLVVLALFIPPLAVYLYEGFWTERCTINLILTLLCGLPGLIHALVVIIGNR
ncbi:MAG: YqaE/Pmp3 family membrane protein [Crocinitomicaceae bacterium]|mgnify:FL=1|tara:strand:+ start:2332 stop:2949 length:618 start_codon:yes stop_codon:yes gene_type:complete